MSEPLTTELLATQLQVLGFSTAFGVPDSLLKGLESALRSRDVEVTICANEGAALAMAGGAYLGDRQPAVVFLQNSGLGNLVNPLVSLVHRRVYGLPALLIVGWRGRPGSSDEPQHLLQGEITEGMLAQCEIPYWIVNCADEWIKASEQAKRTMIDTQSPAAVLVSGTDSSGPEQIRGGDEVFVRSDALRSIWENSNSDDVFFLTTGKAGREMLAISGDRGERVFLNVGAMGHVGSVALAYASKTPGRRSICVDGDGALQMHLGAAATLGNSTEENFLHVVLANGIHESVGTAEIANPNVSYSDLARGLGYKTFLEVDTQEDLVKAMQSIWSQTAPRILVINLGYAASDSPPRPDQTLWERRDRFGHDLDR